MRESDKDDCDVQIRRHANGSKCKNIDAAKIRDGDDSASADEEDAHPRPRPWNVLYQLAARGV
jgi:hypothetical protein